MNKNYYIVLVAFFSVAAAFGWNLAINNQTPYEAHVWVYYNACNYDYRIIKPGAIAHVNAKDCLVKRLEGVLVTVPGDSSKNLPIQTMFIRGIIKQRDFSIAIVEEMGKIFVAEKPSQGPTGRYYLFKRTSFLVG